MKKLMFGLLFCMAALTLAASRAAALERQTSSDFTQVSSSASFGVGVSSWVAAPSTGTIDRSRWGMVLSNPSTNTSTMLWRSTNDDFAPVGGSVGHPLAPGQSIVLSFSGFIRVWVRTLNATSEPAFVEEYK